MQTSKERFRTLRGLATLLALLAIPLLGSSQDGRRAREEGSQPREQVEGARGVLGEWIETRRLIAAEKRDWALGRELLGDRIDLVEREITGLQDRVKEAQGNISQADRKLEELQKDRDRLMEAAKDLAGRVVALERRTRRILPLLPEPLGTRVKPLSQRLPRAGKECRLSLGERFQNVVGILSELNKFNGEITLASEVRDLGEGTSAEVTTLYLGLGQAYYTTAKGDAAGVGTVGEAGWVWRRDNSIAKAVLAAVAIMKNEQAAAFIQLPVRMSDQGEK